MRGAVLTRTCGWFPFVVTEVGLRCMEADSFAWVKTTRKFDETLIPLPPHRDEAEATLVSKLTLEHHFTAENAAATAKQLFTDAFESAKKEGNVDDTLCPEEP